MRTISIEVNGDATVMVDGVALSPTYQTTRGQIPLVVAGGLLELEDDEPLRHDTPREVIIASIVHEVNRRYCQSIGDDSQVPWSKAPGWQQASAIDGVRAIIAGEITRPEQSHERWMAVKENDGWVYGPQKDAVAKTHPSMVSYDKLSPQDRKKDRLFFTVVTALLAPE